MPNFTAGTSFTDGVTNDVTAAKLNALVADAVPTSSLSLNSTTGTIATFNSTTGTITTGVIPTLTSTTLITTGTGTAATPAIQPTGDTNTGIFFPAADTIAFSEGGAEAMRIDSSGNVGIGNTPSQKLDVNGASAIRGTLFLGDGSSSVIRKLTSSTPLTFANQGGSAEMTIDSSGNVGIGETSILGRLSVKGSTTTSSSFSVYVTDSAGSSEFFVRDDGLIGTGVLANSPYNFTTANAANCNIATNGFLGRSTSSIKYKKDISNLTHGLTEVLKLRPVTYKGKSEYDGSKVFGGLIAEEVHNAGLTEFVQYAEDGSPDSLSYGNMVSLAFKAIQELKAENDSLKSRIEALEAK